MISSKLSPMTMSITQTKQNILIHNFNFDEKTFVRFKKFNKKNDKIASCFQKSRPN